MVRMPRSVLVGGTSKSALLAELQRNGVELNDIARTLFAHPDFETSEVGLILVTAAVSVDELGYARGATIDQVFASAAERGLSSCPLELAPHLRLQFMDQPEGFWGHPSSEHRAPPGSLTIASRPIAAEDGASMGFYLRRIRGVPWLRGYRSPAEHVWSADDHFVFSRAPEAAAS